MTTRSRTQHTGRFPAALALLAVVAAALAGCGGGAAADGSDAPPARRSGPGIATTIDSALFTVDCTFSHRAADDPIVYPGQPGASHMHDFFGAEGTDAASTAESLRGTATSCEDREDTAAYWVPTVYDGDRPVDPNRIRAYYRAAVGADVTEVADLPPGIELIAGDMHRPAGDWPDLGQVGWGCGWRPLRYHRTPPTDCTPNSPLTLRLVFADCWDGRNVRSADHRSHVAYSTNGVCPAPHPVPIVQVQVSVEYPVWAPIAGRPGIDASRLTLASGRFEGAHGDVFNAWDPTRLSAQTDICVRAMANCTMG